LNAKSVALVVLKAIVEVVIGLVFWLWRRVLRNGIAGKDPAFEFFDGSFLIGALGIAHVVC